MPRTNEEAHQVDVVAGELGLLFETAMNITGLTELRDIDLLGHQDSFLRYADRACRMRGIFSTDFF